MEKKYVEVKGLEKEWENGDRMEGRKELKKRRKEWTDWGIERRGIIGISMWKE